MKVLCHRENPRFGAEGFTIVEAVVALTIIGIGIGSFMMAMSQLNREASVGRNATGAGAILQNQIDLVLSDGPFNPQKTNEDGSAQIPPELVPGTRDVPYIDPSTGVQSPLAYPWPVYREPARWTYANAAARTGASGFFPNDIGQFAYQSDTQTYWRLQSTAPTWAQDSSDGIIVRGKLTATIVDTRPNLGAPYIYRATFKVEYFYHGQKYTVSRDTVRTSDI